MVTADRYNFQVATYFTSERNIVITNIKSVIFLVYALWTAGARTLASAYIASFLVCRRVTSTYRQINIIKLAWYLYSSYSLDLITGKNLTLFYGKFAFTVFEQKYNKILDGVYNWFLSNPSFLSSIHIITIWDFMQVINSLTYWWV